MQSLRTLCLTIAVFALFIPQLATADPGLLDKPPAYSLDQEHEHEVDYVGEELADEVRDRAFAIHRARTLHRNRQYTAVPGEGALSGLRIGMSAGHGIQWYSRRGQWAFQRDISDHGWGGLREDIHTNQTMMDYLLDMVERSGGEAVTMRERNYGQRALVVDNDAGDGYVELGDWETGASDGFGGTYRYAFLDADGSAEARWEFSVDEDGEYPVYVHYLASRNRTDGARYTVSHLNGQTSRTLSQSELLVEDWERADYPNIPPGADADARDNDLWHYLGTFPFRAGVTYSVAVTNQGSDSETVVIADAVRVGAGDGHVGGGNGQPSGRPRWEEASVPYLEWVGAPDWLKVGDVSGRPLYAIYRGVDAYVSLHTNAGGGSGTSTYTWYKDMWVPKSSWEAGFVENELPPGTDEWGTAIHGEIMRQIRARWDADWTDRGRMGADFGELRAFRNGWYEDEYNRGASDPLAIPAALVELAFHDTDYDARLLREMHFRKDAARAVHAAMIRHLRGADALLPPLPPRSVRARAQEGELIVNWESGEDGVYPNSQADSWRVYTSRDGLLFDPVPIETDDTSITVPLSGCEPLYVRVTAVNDAGESLDSTVVGASQPHDGGARVLFVDGVDREVKTVRDPNNPRTYARIYGPALSAARAGLGFAMSSDEGAGHAIAAAEYDLVVWATGETSTRAQSLALDDQQVIAELLARGTRVLVSGAEIGWDLVERGEASDRDFFESTFGADFAADDANTTEVDVTPLGLTGTMTFGDCSRDAACIEWADVLEPRDGGEVLLAYSAGAAAVESSAGDVVLVGFPLETVADASEREELIGALAERLLGEAGTDAGACPDFGGGGEDAGGDAGHLADAGEADAGGPDAGGPDAGADAANAQRGGEIRTNDGCGCASSEGTPADTFALVLFVAAMACSRWRRLAPRRALSSVASSARGD